MSEELTHEEIVSFNADILIERKGEIIFKTAKARKTGGAYIYVPASWAGKIIKCEVMDDGNTN